MSRTVEFMQFPLLLDTITPDATNTLAVVASAGCWTRNRAILK